MGTLVIYPIVAAVFFLMIARYDIHMFQLSSYRYSRYFRWLVPGNIVSRNRILALLMLLPAIFPNYLGVGFATGITGGAWAAALNEKFKTPLVYTMRVKRLLATNILLFVAIAVLAILFAGKWAITIIGAELLFSNMLMLLANMLNTPIEKAINRHYYNDAKRIIESHKGLIIIGVTGSFGKTSTKNYLASVLAEKYNILVTPGNFNTLLGVVRTIREQLRPYHQVFIVEMGAKQKNDIKEICDLVHPAIGIVTAVGEMHLETFKSIENIQDTKFELINSLPAGGLGVINNDSEYIRNYKGIASRCRIIRYAVENEGEYKASDVNYGASGVSFTLNGGQKYTTRLLGTGNLLNILASIAVADRLGVSPNKQHNAIARLQPVEHRLSMKVANGITVLDDAYNSNPQGARMGLEVLKNFKTGEGNKRIVITPGFVEMGSRQAEANKKLGRIIATSCDYAIVVNATNRDAIRSGIIEGGLAEEKYFLADSLNHAHEQLARIIRPGDVVLYENDLPDNFK